MAGNPALGRRLAQLRGNKTQEEVATVIGISRARYSHYETGRSEPDNEVLQALAKYYAVTVDFLLGLNQTPKPKESTVSTDIVKKSFSDLKDLAKDGFKIIKMVAVPVYKLDVKGEEILAESNIIGWHYVPADKMDYKQMDCICFKVPDDSMSGSGLYMDYIVTVKKQTTAEDGQVAIVKTKDGSARIRRVRYFNDEVLLDPDNPRYQSERVNINDLDIIGVVTDASFEVK